MIHHKKPVIAVIVCLAMTLIMCGCSIASESEMISYSQKNFGSSECVSYTRLDDKSIAVMKDEQYEFTYTVTSYIEDFSFDDTTFFKYEARVSDFFDKYTQYIKNTEIFQNMLKECDAEVDFKSDKYIGMNIRTSERAESASNMLKQVIDSIDSRKYFSNNHFIIYLTDNDNKSAGEYSLDDSNYISPGNAQVTWILESAALSIYDLNEYQGDMPDASQFQYMYSEYMNSSAVPGREHKTYPLRATDTKESLAHTMVVHFMYNNQEWIVADCLGDSDGYLYVYCFKNGHMNATTNSITDITTYITSDVETDSTPLDSIKAALSDN